MTTLRRTIVVATGKAGPTGPDGADGTSAPTMDETTLVVSMSASKWGVDGSDVPYYSSAGVTAADRAFFQIDTSTGLPVLTRIGG